MQAVKSHRAEAPAAGGKGGGGFGLAPATFVLYFWLLARVWSARRTLLYHHLSIITTLVLASQMSWSKRHKRATGVCEDECWGQQHWCQVFKDGGRGQEVLRTWVVGSKKEGQVW